MNEEGPSQKSAGKRFSVPSVGEYKPISGYGVIGNTRTVALVGYDGSIDWCCLPRFDSPSVFAAILDPEKGGRWLIQPTGSSLSTQSYMDETNILRTEFRTEAAHIQLTDFMPCSHTTDAWSTPPEIHRIVSCLSGSAQMRFLFKPTFDYGIQTPVFSASERGLSMRTRKHEMVMSWSVPFELSKDGVDSTFAMVQGQKTTFVLSYGEAAPRGINDYHTERQRARTELFWLDWASQCRYRGRWRAQLLRSALALKLLVYSPTGAVVAAATTSLPEALGENRNWDYRFSWIRDSASSLWAFDVLGFKSETERYLHWLVDNNPALDLDLRLMYDVDGGTNMPERELKHLKGYKGSKPARVGNAASSQLQLDAYGYMLDALYFSHRWGAAVNEEMYYRFVKPLANFIVEHWDEPGNGIWEIRNKREHFVYTKGWCFAGLDRAVKIARATGHKEDVPEWTATKQKIRTQVLRKGWSPKKSSFVMYYGSSDLDAANLMLPLMGFMDAEDEKMRLTIEGIQRELAKGALVYRYRIDDGLKGDEGAFLLCGFWLVACLARLGKVEEAEKNFLELLSHSNHLGLYSEEVEPGSGEALGNFPQAFSHMGLILAAKELETAAQKKQEALAPGNDAGTHG